MYLAFCRFIPMIKRHILYIIAQLSASKSHILHIIAHLSSSERHILYIIAHLLVIRSDQLCVVPSVYGPGLVVETLLFPDDGPV